MAILRLDTPGRLDTSMRETVRTMLASPVPIRIDLLDGLRAVSHAVCGAPATQTTEPAPS